MSKLANVTGNEIVVSTEMKRDFWTSLDLSIVDNQKKVYNISKKSDHRLDDVINSEFNVVDIITSAYENIDEETGSVERGRITTMITDAGLSIATSSTVVFRDLGEICNIFGVPSETNPITVKAIKEKGNNGHSYTTLTVI